MMPTLLGPHASRLLLTLTLAVATAIGCAPPPSPRPDAATPDVGTTDAGTLDAVPIDAPRPMDAPPAGDADAMGTDVSPGDVPSTDVRDTDVRDTDARDTDARDTDARDTDARDTDARDAGLGDVGCVPNCWLRDCGDDGCGGTCGACLPGATCGTSGLCECPESSCGTQVCGRSSCGRSCGSCGPTELCGAGGTCVPYEAPACAGTSCRDRYYQWSCPGATIALECPGDPSRDTLCTCNADGTVTCGGGCYYSVPIACHEGSCGAGMRCNLWTGRCQPEDAPLPPPGREIGAGCASDADCRSNDGVGAGLQPTCQPQSFSNWMGGYCLGYCNAPPEGFETTDRILPSNCPSGAVCVTAVPGGAGSPGGYGTCVDECTSDSDCRTAEGYYCRRTIWGRTYTNGYCAPLHCRSRGCRGYVCGC